MKISVDTKEDSHEEIKRAIKLLQNIVGESQEVFTNEPSSVESNDSQESQAEPGFMNMFGDSQDQTENTASESSQETPSEQTEASENYSNPEIVQQEATEAPDPVSTIIDDVSPESTPAPHAIDPESEPKELTEPQQVDTNQKQSSDSTEELFKELFSDEDLQKMKEAEDKKPDDDGDDESGATHKIELY